MTKVINIIYWTECGPGDTCDPVEYPLDLTEAEYAEYKRALRLRIDPNTVPVLREALDRIYPDVEQQEVDNLLDAEDEFTMECQGTAQKDPDEINDLVHDRDPHALKFFHLTKLSDEELDAWDANDEEMPTIEEFEEGFIPQSPFDCGWRLRLSIPNPREDEPLGDEESRAIIAELFRCKNGPGEVRYFVRCCSDNYNGEAASLADVAVNVAEKLGVKGFEV